MVLYLLTKATPPTWTPATTLLRLVDADRREYVFCTTGNAKKKADGMATRMFYGFSISGSMLKSPPPVTRYGFEALFEVRFDASFNMNKDVEPFKVVLPEIAPSFAEINQKDIGCHFDIIGYIKDTVDVDNTSLMKTEVTLVADAGELDVEILGETRSMLSAVSKNDLVLITSCRLNEYQQRRTVVTSFLTYIQKMKICDTSPQRPDAEDIALLVCLYVFFLYLKH